MNPKEILKVISILLLFSMVIVLISNLTKTRRVAANMRDERDLERERNRFLANRNEQLRHQISMLYNEIMFLRTSIENGKSIDQTLLAKLDGMISMFGPINEPITLELVSVKKLIEVEEPTKATFTLAKVVENQLKVKCEADDSFAVTIGSRNPTFNDYLNHAVRNGYIDNEEFNFAKGLKDLRNQEAHEVDVRKEKGVIQCAMLFGMGLILKLSAI